MDLREVIKAELASRGWPQRELCRRTGIMPGKVSDFLGGRADMRSESVNKLLAALELEIRPRRRRRKG